MKWCSGVVRVVSRGVCGGDSVGNVLLRWCSKCLMMVVVLLYGVVDKKGVSWCVSVVVVVLNGSCGVVMCCIMVLY